MHISRKSSAEPTLGADAMKSGARDARRKAQSPVPELNSTRDRSLRRSTVLRISLYAVLVIIGLQTLAILVLNAGHLVFTVDDAYIHLALAENLLQGHYGVNLTEFSSPASSVLWPFLIAPFSTTAVASYVVLLINAGSALLTVLVIWHILSSSSVDMPRDGLSPRTLLLWMAFLTVACNIIGLVFLGMEHSLQLLLASTIVLGLIRETQTREADWWLVAALVAAPLIRYEDLFLAGPAIVFLFFRSHRGKAVVSAGLIAVTLGAFSAYLSSHQSGFLPTSVMAKSGYGGGCTASSGSQPRRCGPTSNRPRERCSRWRYQSWPLSCLTGRGTPATGRSRPWSSRPSRSTCVSGRPEGSAVMSRISGARRYSPTCTCTRTC